MAQHREGFGTQGWECRQPFCHGSARSRIWDAGPSQLSMEQGLRHKAGGMEQLGMDTMAFWLFLVSFGPYNVRTLSGSRASTPKPFL